MKVIIQDIVGQEFLGANGWVATKEGAKDFFTLLSAYHFAQANTSVRFRVLLHCPEDGYSAAIVDGIGKAETESSPEVFVPVIIDDKSANRLGQHWVQGLDASRIYLN